MAYSYLPDFPQASRGRIKAIEIQAGFELGDSKQQRSRLSDFETDVRKYILTVFSAFAEEALALGQRGSWTVEIVDREAREFLASITLQTQLEKGYDRRGHSISPLTNHVFGHILPEVRRELEQSSVRRRYQEQLAEVARLQESSSAEQPPKISRENGPAAVSRRGEDGTGAQKKSTHPARAQKWDEVKISFLSEERIQVWVAGQPETFNYAEFGCIDQRSGLANRVWEMLKLLACNEGVIPDSGRISDKQWPATEKALERLRRLLRRRFGIAENPLPFRRGIGYRLRCKIGNAVSFDK
jgi:hypothetical protein